MCSLKKRLTGICERKHWAIWCFSNGSDVGNLRLVDVLTEDLSENISRKKNQAHLLFPYMLWWDRVSWMPWTNERLLPLIFPEHSYKATGLRRNIQLTSSLRVSWWTWYVILIHLALTRFSGTNSTQENSYTPGWSKLCMELFSQQLFFITNCPSILRTMDSWWTIMTCVHSTRWLMENNWLFNFTSMIWKRRTKIRRCLMAF